MYILVLPAIILIIGFFALYYSWATMLLWNWLAVPIGLPVIGLAQAYGLWLLVAMFRNVKTESKGERDWQQELTTALAKPAVLLVLGYIVHRFFLAS